MKKILLSIFFVSASINAQTNVFSEDFEQITDLQSAGWTLYNDTNTPFGTYATAFPNAWNIIAWTAESGNTVASCPSWFTTVTPADRWLVTPAIVLPSNNSIALEYFARSHDTSPFDDGFKLKISTTNKDKSAFTDIQTVAHAVNGPIATLDPYTLDLSTYAGKTVYLAWVNTYTNGNLLSVDEINVTATPKMAVSDVNKIKTNLYPNPAKNEFQLTLQEKNLKSLKIYDISGKLVKEFSESDHYDISDLKAGVYNVSVLEASGSIENIKLIKK